MRRTLSESLISLMLLAAAAAAPMAGQTLIKASGDGQLVLENFLTIPMTVRALDSAGRPMPNVALEWTSSPASAGTLREPAATTDANGYASVVFLASIVDPGNSYRAANITARSSFGSATFFTTISAVRFPNGSTGAPPLVELLKPEAETNLVEGTAGGIVAEAIKVRVSVQSGPQSGTPLPNVGVRVFNYKDPANSTSAVCKSASGTILTDARGEVLCDLQLNDRVGTEQLAMMVGESQRTRDFNLKINAGAPCAYQISPTIRQFGAAGGAGSFFINTAGHCPWNIQQSFPVWLLPASPMSGTGSAEFQYSVIGNTAVTPREGSIQVLGSTQSLIHLVTQSAAGISGGALDISSPAVITGATVGQFYTYSFQAAGGQPPYRWQLAPNGTIPAGLNLSQSGILSGVPSAAGTFVIPIAVIDSATASASRTFQLSIVNSDSTQNPVITNGSFPNASLLQTYRQQITNTGCQGTLGSPTFQYSISSGQLPPGLALSQEGAIWYITGTPTTVGAYTFTLSAKDPCGRATSANYTITVVSQTSNNSSLRSNPDALVFNVTAGSSVAPASQFLQVIATGALQLNYSASATVPWLEVSGNIAGLTPGSFAVSVKNFNALPVGTQIGKVLVSSVGLAPLEVTVFLNVNAAPQVQVSPSVLQFAAEYTTSPVAAGRIRQSLTLVGQPGASFQATRTTRNGGAWLIVTPSSGVYSSTGRATVDVDINNALMAPGTYEGEVQVGAPGNPTRVPVFLTVNNQARLNWSTSGLSFAATPSDPSLAPQTIRLTSTGAPIRVNVAASVITQGTNWLKVTPTTGTTDLDVTVSVDITGLSPGSYFGDISARPADGSSNAAIAAIRVSLIVSQTTPAISLVVHAASEQPGPVAPGSWAAVRGTFLGSSGVPVDYKVTNGRVDTTLSDVRILVDGVAAPILSASSQRTVFQVPYSAVNKDRISVVAEYKGQRSEPVQVPITLVNPALFVDGTTQGLITNEDGSNNSQSRPADPTTVVTLLATGEGMTDPTGTDGLINADPGPKPVAFPVQVWMDGQEAEVISYGGAPGKPSGLMQIKARIPANVTRGASVPVTMGINGNYTPDLVTVAIKP